MRLDEAEEIIACMPSGKTPFWYFRDRYAVLLLALAGEALDKRAIQRSSFAQLLDKAVVKDVLAKHRSGKVPSNAFENQVWASPECYSLTLDTWGSNTRDDYLQTTRLGHNVVLQLNFPASHDQIYRRFIDLHGAYPFAAYGHPVLRSRHNTLAWARLDIDLDKREALIEEIQSDWLRIANWYRPDTSKRDTDDYYWHDSANPVDVMRYYTEELSKYVLWDEAMLAAAIWFLRHELGVTTIYFHTYDSGAALKRTEGIKPPRSIYSRLPRRFCFQPTDQRPSFMRGSVRTVCSKRSVRLAKFQLLAFDDTGITG
ncbi:MAG: hypothetical protein AAGH76_02935 [Pseudomonadota bacterium]